MGTAYKGTAKERLNLDAYIKLMRATESVTVRINRRVVNPVLTISQFGVLEALLHLGPLCQSELARKILKSSGNITMVIDNLEKRGFVRRERGSDRRFLTIHLTVPGRELIESLFPHHVQAVCDELSVLTEGELRELARICRKLGLGGQEG